jgi:hypothetical protein
VTFTLTVIDLSTNTPPVLKGMSAVVASYKLSDIGDSLSLGPVFDAEDETVTATVTVLPSGSFFTFDATTGVLSIDRASLTKLQ